MFRYPSWAAPLFFIIGVAGLYLAYQFRADESRAVFSLFLLFGVLGTITFIETLTAYLRLLEDTLETRSNFRTTRIPKKRISEVTWEKGVGTSVKLSDGTWHRLPDFWSSSPMVARAIREWLKGD